MIYSQHDGNPNLGCDPQVDKRWYRLSQNMIHSDLWYANWHWTRCFLEYFSLPHSESLHQYSTLIFSMLYNLNKGQHHYIKHCSFKDWQLMWKFTAHWELNFKTRVKSQINIPTFCIFSDIKHFLYGRGQMPIRTMFPRFYAILGGPHKNLNLRFYCTMSCQKCTPVFFILLIIIYTSIF